jgi:hypothetical protein
MRPGLGNVLSPQTSGLSSYGLHLVYKTWSQERTGAHFGLSGYKLQGLQDQIPAGRSCTQGFCTRH